MALCLPGTRCIGVDPNPDISYAVPRRAAIVRATSDRFFDTGMLEGIVGSKTVDFAFIDGMHLAEYVLRDLANLARSCNETSLIAIHDCLPRSMQEAARAPSPALGSWAGDVWRAILVLRQYAPVKLHLLDVAPTGLALVSGFKPSTFQLNADRLTSALASVPTDFSVGMDQVREKCSVIAGTSEALRAFLETLPRRGKPAGTLSLFVRDSRWRWARLKRRLARRTNRRRTDD
jgi:hypothetical protein